MTTEQAIKLMLVEATCIERASNADHQCTRECEKCDLLQTNEDLIAAYGMAVSALRAQAERDAIIRDIKADIPPGDTYSAALVLELLGGEQNQPAATDSTPCFPGQGAYRN